MDTLMRCRDTWSNCVPVNKLQEIFFFLLYEFRRCGTWILSLIEQYKPRKPQQNLVITPKKKHFITTNEKCCKKNGKVIMSRSEKNATWDACLLIGDDEPRKRSATKLPMVITVKNAHLVNRKRNYGWNIVWKEPRYCRWFGKRRNRCQRKT